MHGPVPYPVVAHVAKSSLGWYSTSIGAGKQDAGGTICGAEQTIPKSFGPSHAGNRIMTRIVVLGAGGMLGHKVCQRLREHDVTGVVRKSASAYKAFREIFDRVSLVGNVDVLKDGQLESVLLDMNPQIVVNCVGVVKQLPEAEDALLSVATNALLPHRLARLCEKIGARLIHISTDCVFGGCRGSYRESDPTDARDLYGRSKALGETILNEEAAVTLRTSFIGRELKSEKHGLVEWFLARDGGGVEGFANVIYSGLTSIELADVIHHLVERRPDLRGVYQVASAPISKYHLLLLIRRVYDLDIEVRRAVEPVCDRSLVMEAFSEATGYRAPTWEEMIQQMYQDHTPYGAWRSRPETMP